MLNKNQSEFKFLLFQNIAKSYLELYEMDPVYNAVKQDDTCFIARQLIEKEHPEALEYFDNHYQIKTDIVEKIESIIKLNLNNKLSNTDVKQKSLSYLETCGYTKLPGFQEAWELMINLYQLPK